MARVQHERHEHNIKNKSAKRVRNEQHQCNKIATRVQHERHDCDTSESFDFDNETSENIFSRLYINYIANE